MKSFLLLLLLSFSFGTKLLAQEPAPAVQTTVDAVSILKASDLLLALLQYSISFDGAFTEIADEKIKRIARQPDIGNLTTLKNIRSVPAGKGYQNRIYYRVTKDRLIVINMIDARRNPKKNPFNKNT